VKKDVKELVGICGLYCGTCPVYLASREQDPAQLEAMSRDRGIPVEEIRCDGCLSENVYGPCVDCRHGFRRCASEKRVTWCFECEEFPCRRLRDFTDVHIVNGISHHAGVIEALQSMKEHGIEKWLEAQEREACCPTCGKKLYWFVRECPVCRTTVR